MIDMKNWIIESPAPDADHKDGEYVSPYEPISEEAIAKMPEEVQQAIRTFQYIDVNELADGGAAAATVLINVDDETLALMPSYLQEAIAHIREIEADIMHFLREDRH